MGIDIGTSRVKTVITDLNGNVISSYDVDNEVNFLRPGWVEQTPDYHWWEKTVEAIKGCIKLARISPESILAVGISGLSVNLVPIDKNGKVIRPAILYMDTRSIPEIDWLKDKVGNNVFLRINGNPISHRMLVPKILWYMKNEPENYDKTWKIIVSSHGYVIYRLCGEIVTDYYVADMTGLSNYKQGKWSDEICNLINIDTDKLPSISASYEIAGYISRSASKATGLPEDIPVITGSCDANISTLSIGVINAGESMLSYSTVGAAYICVSKPVVHRGLYFGHYVRPGYWVSVIAMQCAGAIVKWFRDQFGYEEKKIAEKQKLSTYQILDEKAAYIPPGSDGLVVLPYFMGERSPIMDPKARGVIFGLTLFHTKIHLYRAILEAFGYGLLHHVEILKEMGINIRKWLAVNGGAKSRLWRQIISDITGIPQYYAVNHPGAPLGDAFLAGIGIREIKNWNTIKKWVRFDEITRPNIRNRKIYKKLYKVYRDLYIKLKDDMWFIADLTS